MSITQLHGLWRLDRQRSFIALIGALIYGLLWSLGHLLTLPNLLFISIRPAVAVPIFCGLMWGPVVGFIVGALGLFLGDFITPLDFPLYWEVSAGLLGLTAGLAGFFGLDYRSWRSYLTAEIWALIAVYVSLDYITVRQVAYEALSQDPWGAIFMPVFITNSANALVLIPILIWVYRRWVNRQP